MGKSLIYKNPSRHFIAEMQKKQSKRDFLKKAIPPVDSMQRYFNTWEQVIKSR